MFEKVLCVLFLAAGFPAAQELPPGKQDPKLQEAARRGHMKAVELEDQMAQERATIHELERRMIELKERIDRLSEEDPARAQLHVELAYHNAERERHRAKLMSLELEFQRTRNRQGAIPATEPPRPGGKLPPEKADRVRDRIVRLHALAEQAKRLGEAEEAARIWKKAQALEEELRREEEAREESITVTKKGFKDNQVKSRQQTTKTFGSKAEQQRNELLEKIHALEREKDLAISEGRSRDATELGMRLEKLHGELRRLGAEPGAPRPQDPAAELQHEIEKLRQELRALREDLERLKGLPRKERPPDKAGR